MYDLIDEVPSDRILLVGHGLLGALGPAAQRPGLVQWAGERQVRLYQLPRPAFTLSPPSEHGRTRPPQVAERLAELDDLVAAFEEVAAQLAAGGRVIGLAVPGRLVTTRSGRAWLERVRAIARDIAALAAIEVWTVTAGHAALYDPTVQPIRTAS
jgi:hypothetical protein